jgi:hypothetical protein
MVVLLEASPIATEELWSSVRVTIVFHLHDQGPSPPIAQFVWAASSRKSLGGSKPLQFKNDLRPLCSWGHSMLQNIFGTLPQICALTQSCLRALRTIPSASWLGFCSNMHSQMWDLIQADVYFSKSCPIN